MNIISIRIEPVSYGSGIEDPLKFSVLIIILHHCFVLVPCGIVIPIVGAAIANYTFQQGEQTGAVLHIVACSVLFITLLLSALCVYSMIVCSLILNSESSNKFTIAARIFLPFIICTVCGVCISICISTAAFSISIFKSGYYELGLGFSICVGGITLILTAILTLPCFIILLVGCVKKDKIDAYRSV